MNYYLRSKDSLNAYMVFGSSPLPDGTHRKVGYHIPPAIIEPFATFTDKEQAEAIAKVLNEENPNLSLVVVEGREFWATRGFSQCQMIVIPNGGSPRVHIWFNGQPASVNLVYTQVEALSQCIDEWQYSQI